MFSTYVVFVGNLPSPHPNLCNDQENGQGRACQYSCSDQTQD